MNLCNFLSVTNGLGASNSTCKQEIIHIIINTLPMFCNLIHTLLESLNESLSLKICMRVIRCNVAVIDYTEIAKFFEFLRSELSSIIRNKLLNNP